MPRRLARTALEAARKIEEADDRAAYLEAQIAHVDKPAKLVEPWVDALFDGTLELDAVAAKACAMARTFVSSADVLTEIGCQLDNLCRDDEAIEVLELARAARGRSRRMYEALGRLLLLRGDASGARLLDTAIELAPAWAPPRITLAGYLAEREPDRARELLAQIDSGRGCDLRSMLCAATEPALANELLHAALAHFDDDLVGHQELADWHLVERRFARARFHATALLARRQALAPQELATHDVQGIDATIVIAYRLGGDFAELLPWLQELCNDEVPPRCALDIFYGLTSYHPTPDLRLALRAAETQATHERDLDEARRWRVRIAGLRAQELGDIASLEALARDGLDDRAVAWIELADQYRCVGLYDAAHASLDRALQLDPDSAEALDTLFTIALATGDLATMDRTARALAGKRSDCHEGSENLGRTFARRGDGAEAVVHARRALDRSPYCHNAWTGLGEALLVAGDFASARDAVARSLALEAAQPGDDISVLRAALARDPGALEAALGLRYQHLSALPFPAFIEKLRAAARSMP